MQYLNKKNHTTVQFGTDPFKTMCKPQYDYQCLVQNKYHLVETLRPSSANCGNLTHKENLSVTAQQWKKTMAKHSKD
jgi:hypothetical protein